MSNEEINLKVKAKELFKKYYKLTHPLTTMSEAHETAKQCALIDIQNTIDALKYVDEYIHINCYNFYLDKIVELTAIKQAIENL